MKAAMDQRLVVGVVQSPEAVMHCPTSLSVALLLPWTIPRRDCSAVPWPGVFSAWQSLPAVGLHRVWENTTSRCMQVSWACPPPNWPCCVRLG